MKDPWRYKLPCGHHAMRHHPNNEPDRRYECLNCGDRYAKDDVIDKKAAVMGDETDR